MTQINPIHAALLVALRQTRARYYMAVGFTLNTELQVQCRIMDRELIALEEELKIEGFEVPSYCWRSRYTPCEAAGVEPGYQCRDCRKRHRKGVTK